jgi:hypothetical protein
VADEEDLRESTDHLHREISDEEATRRRELLSKLRAFQDRLREKYGELGDSTPGIRADRQRWG